MMDVGRRRGNSERRASAAATGLSVPAFTPGRRECRGGPNLRGQHRSSTSRRSIHRGVGGVGDGAVVSCRGPLGFVRPPPPARAAPLGPPHRRAVDDQLLPARADLDSKGPRSGGRERGDGDELLVDRGPGVEADRLEERRAPVDLHRAARRAGRRDQGDPLRNDAGPGELRAVGIGAPPGGSVVGGAGSVGPAPGARERAVVERDRGARLGRPRRLDPSGVARLGNFRTSYLLPRGDVDASGERV
jgi:hypothetical protein